MDENPYESPRETPEPVVDPTVSPGDFGTFAVLVGVMYHSAAGFVLAAIWGVTVTLLANADYIVSTGGPTGRLLSYLMSVIMTFGIVGAVIGIFSGLPTGVWLGRMIRRSRSEAVARRRCCLAHAALGGGLMEIAFILTLLSGPKLVQLNGLPGILLVTAILGIPISGTGIGYLTGALMFRRLVQARLGGRP